MEKSPLRIAEPRSVPRRGLGPQSRALLLASAYPLRGSTQPNLLLRLNARQRESVLARSRPIVFNRGNMVFRQGEPHDGIFLVESGLIRVFYSSPSGREITLAYWYPGNFVGGPEIFGIGIYHWSAVAVRTSSVYSLAGADLEVLVDNIPAFARGIIDGLIFKGKCYSALAQILGTHSVTQRLAQLLQSLCQIYGVPQADGVLIDAAFSHQDIAHLVGATRQWVTATLQRFGNLGVVRTTDGRLTVIRSEFLEEMTDARHAKGDEMLEN